MCKRLSAKPEPAMLLDALLRHPIVAGDVHLAELLADAGEVVEFDSGETIFERGDPSGASFFVLCGTVAILVKDQPVAFRDAGVLVGEAAALDPTSPRPASLKAQTQVVALKVAPPVLDEAERITPQIWRRLAVLFMERWRDWGSGT